jgi:lipid-A-disaccharide synthase-like uncharacterized protein
MKKINIIKRYFSSLVRLRLELAHESRWNIRWICSSEKAGRCYWPLQFYISCYEKLRNFQDRTMFALDRNVYHALVVNQLVGVTGMMLSLETIGAGDWSLRYEVLGILYYHKYTVTLLWLAATQKSRSSFLRAFYYYNVLTFWTSAFEEQGSSSLEDWKLD